MKKSQLPKRIIILISLEIVMILILIGLGGVAFYFKQVELAVDTTILGPIKSKLKALETVIEPPQQNHVSNLLLENLFSDAEDKTWQNYPEENLVQIISTGDIMVGRYVNVKVSRTGNYNYPYLETRDILSAADLTVGNLETPLIANCPFTSEGMIFCADLRHAGGLAWAGFDLVSLANNHILNHGQAGLFQTQEILTDNKLAYISNEVTWKKTIKDTKFAFLAFNDVSEQIDINAITGQVNKLKKEADVVVVMPHWGAEYTRVPKAARGVAPHDPKILSHHLIDAGADLILGNHPHWYQGFEIYKNKLITYSHGNFIFDQEWSEETKTGIVGKYIFYKDKLVDIEIYPVYIEGYVQPRWITGEKADSIRAELLKHSWE